MTTKPTKTTLIDGTAKSRKQAPKTTLTCRYQRSEELLTLASLIVAPLAILLMLSFSGCVERLITVNTQPTGAIVWLNGEEIGSAPVTTEFTWYGQYEVTIRKDGFQTIKTARKAPTPFYEWPPLDLIAECFLPLKLTDHHRWNFELAPQAPADPNQLIERAKSFRKESLTSP